jgi:cyclic beta-1,2-glucan synthetase
VVRRLPAGGAEFDEYDVVYTEDRARIVQGDRASLEIALDVIVSPQDDAELRRLTVTNRASRDRARSTSPPTPRSS